VREVTSDCVVCAFDSGNLPSVALNIGAKYSDSELLIAADNDDAGLSSGRKAMHRGNASHMVCPPVPGMDWNDHHQRYGKEHTAQTIENLINVTRK
jgi:phage/plasmid primase-like uncharacterized protein